MKCIVICADGTWNRPEKDPEDQPTNVLKLARAVKPLASDGIGQQLLQWLRDIAVSEGCQFFHLDSGTHRGHAHKFYFEQGLTIASYHFSEKLKS